MTTTPVGSATCSPRIAPNATSTAPLGSTPTACAAATAAEQVHAAGAAGERHLELDAAARGATDRGTCGAIEVLEVDVGRRTRTTSSPSRRYGLEQRLVGGHDRDAARAASSSPFAAATPSSDPTSSRWTGPMFVITPTSGSAIAASSAICPNPRIAISSTSTSVPAGAASTASGSPISVLKFAGLAATAPLRRDQRRDQLLRRGLADRAGDRDHGGAERPAARRVASAPQRRQRVVGDEHRAPGEPARVLAARPARPRRRPRSASAANRAAVDVLAAQADEEVAGLDRARVDRRARVGPRARRRRARPARAQLARRRPAPRLGRSSALMRDDHRRCASRATATSSNGSLRPPSNSWPCSWPLPAITTTSPGSRELDRAEIAARRSTSRSTRRAATPGSRPTSPR